MKYRVTFPEGYTVKQIAARLEKREIIDNQEEFLSVAFSAEMTTILGIAGESIEGYLFPDTYLLTKGLTPDEVIKIMVAHFKRVYKPDFSLRAAELGITDHEIITLASIIEKETGLPEERPLISAVFHNRLKIGMKLDCDPTIIYVLKLEGRFKDRLRTRDLKYDSLFNTYLYSGLPPGPIANPGKDSLEAALYPADEKFLYFVSKNDGSHHFSETFREHANAVNKYQRR